MRLSLWGKIKREWNESQYLLGILVGMIIFSPILIGILVVRKFKSIIN